MSNSIGDSWQASAQGLLAVGSFIMASQFGLRHETLVAVGFTFFGVACVLQVVAYMKRREKDNPDGLGEAYARLKPSPEEVKRYRMEHPRLSVGEAIIAMDEENQKRQRG